MPNSPTDSMLEYLIHGFMNLQTEEECLSFLRDLCTESELLEMSRRLQAAKMLKNEGVNAKFFIAGTGSYEGHLKEKVKELGLSDTVIFTGFITDVDKLMSITDIQANASYGTEATSLALLEGMSIGVPGVVSDFGGNPGVIMDGENGFVVAKQNSVALKDGLKKLLEDSELYQKMSQRSKEIFNETFTSRIMTKNTEDIYSETIGKERNKRR